MLYAIHKGNIEAYTGGQHEVLHLAGNAERVARTPGLAYCLTDGHAEIAFSEFFENLDDLNKIDWKIMHEKFWSDTVEDMDRKRRRQAEFLVHRFCPWEMILEIAVMDARTADAAGKVIAGCRHQPNIVTEREWYY